MSYNATKLMTRTLNFGITLKKWGLSTKSLFQAFLCYNLALQEDFKSSFICPVILFTVRAGGHTQIPLKVHPRISKIHSY